MVETLHQNPNCRAGFGKRSRMFPRSTRRFAGVATCTLALQQTRGSDVATALAARCLLGMKHTTFGSMILMALSLNACGFVRVQGLGSGAQSTPGGGMQSSPGASKTNAAAGGADQDDDPNMSSNVKALRKEWRVKAEAAFERWWNTIVPLLENETKAVAAIQSSADDHYVKREALRSLWTEIQQSPHASERSYRLLLQYPIEKALREIHGTSLAFAVPRSEAMMRFEKGPAEFRRPLGKKEDEHDLFLAQAVVGAMSDTGVSSFYEPGSFPLGAARSKKAAATLEEAKKASIARDDISTSVADINSDKVQPGSAVQVLANYNGDNPSDGETDRVVTAVSATGIVFTNARRTTRNIGNCKREWGTTGGIPGWISICDHKTTESKFVVTAEVASWPPVKIQVGDKVIVRCTLKEMKGEKGEGNRSARCTDVYVENITRKNELLFGWK
jgi:hypothetical protein